MPVSGDERNSLSHHIVTLTAAGHDHTVSSMTSPDSMTASTATLRIIDRIGDIDGTAWNALGARPFSLPAPRIPHSALRKKIVWASALAGCRGT